MLPELVPGITLQLMGHATPGRCCSELQLEAMAIERSPVNPARAAFAVARALARVCEDRRTRAVSVEGNPSSCTRLPPRLARLNPKVLGRELGL
jgi:hypothetical protein